jgi:hypothetical protein
LAIIQLVTRKRFPRDGPATLEVVAKLARRPFAIDVANDFSAVLKSALVVRPDRWTNTCASSICSAEVIAFHGSG